MLETFLQSEPLRAFEHAVSEGDSVLIEELWNSPKALVCSLAQKATGKHLLILTGASSEEFKLFHDFPLFSNRPVLDFPSWETLPGEAIAPSPDIVGERYEVLSRLHEETQPLIVISGLQAALQKMIEPSQFQRLYLSLKKGDSYPFQELIDQLIDMGYERKPVAADKGEFAVRGGIIDLFPVSSPDPFRLEFFGDEIESIRHYDPIGQKSIRPSEGLEVTPAREKELIEEAENLGTILDHLGENTLVIFDDLLQLEDRYSSLLNIKGSASRTFLGIEELLEKTAPLQKLYLADRPIEELSPITLKGKSSGSYYSEKAPMRELSFEMFNRKLEGKRWANPFAPLAPYLLPDHPNPSGEELLRSLGALSNTDWHLRFLCDNDAEKGTLQKKLTDIPLPSDTDFKLGYLSSGFAIPDIHHLVVPMTEITQRYKIRRQKLRSTYHTTPSEVYEIAPGDAVVHLNNGIGKFLGIERKENHEGVENEYLLLEYAENSKLYVPVNQAHLITKYVGSNEQIPKLHTLGSSKWKRTRENTERAILGYASDLLQLYAKREIKGGHTYPEDSPDLLSFESTFPFVETEDQLAAIGNIKQDMTSHKAMDRLVCGDVGYGKTEVAMRAAFKAVVDGGKQVAMLVPTTVLAMQHFENFVERMRDFPLRIEVLSRFRTGKQIKSALEGIEKGSVDIVIGTHRLISKDVAFKNLGMIIIDEEQRFGVRAKEHLKKIKTGVDCLTLSATPIPRTLYMSLIGARDLSVINTPPQDRLPIKTIITEPSDQLIKNALLRELARDGQAYVIHNRVESIYALADRIKKLLPQARIVVGHGQMHADEIDMAFHAFKSGQADILVATSIVENGIDIPNANTTIIDRADQFGLSDLYQLRGRVGRWNKRAYAYFLIPKLHRLPEITRKRLNALAESSGYGGGMKLAMRDLEIRGAGDILGTEQSGHISSIGFYLYCKLLKKTIRSLEGKMPSVMTDTRVEIPMNAKLPEYYVNASSLRMEFYQRLGEAVTVGDVDEILGELKDRFGPPPEPALWLYHLSRVRVHASRNGYTLVKVDKGILTTEQKKGKETTVRKVMFKLPGSPEEMEKRLIEKLG